MLCQIFNQGFGFSLQSVYFIKVIYKVLIFI